MHQPDGAFGQEFNTPDEQTVPGLVHPVQVYRDPWGIPHIQARCEQDAFFAQGYVHAQDRLWQMDACRLRMEGRWAEWAGPSAVAGDTLARRLGGRAASERDYAALGKPARQMLHAYSEGVNAYLAQGRPLPMEYGLLKIVPSAWEPWHCIAVMRWRGFLMGSVWFKLWRAAALRAIGPEQIGKLRYDDGGEDLLCIPPGEEASRWIATLQELAPAIEALADLGALDATGGGSNNWAVSPGRTATGRPLLAGDPHRQFEMPGMYMQNHVACDRFDVIGLAVPGVPGFPHFAHNGRVAWCVTHAFADIHDLFVERFQDDGRQYQTPTGWDVATTRHETLQVRGAPAVSIAIVETRHGPVIAGTPSSGSALVLRSVQFAELDRSFDCLPRLMTATTVDELFAATRGWGLIDHNLVAADTQGRIGHLVRAVVPHRPRLNGWLPVPGWTGTYDWAGSIAWEDMPRSFDPPRGFLVTANNRFQAEAADDALYFCTDCHPPHRARRIETRLASLSAATVDDMAQIHSDVESLTAPVFQERLRLLQPQPGKSGDLQALIANWNGHMDADSVGAAGYTAWRWELAAVLLERSGLARTRHDPLTQLPPGVVPVNQLWWTLPQLVRANDITLLGGLDWNQAFIEALERAAGRQEGHPWGRQHPAAMVHPLATQFPQAAAQLSPMGSDLGGDNDTVLANGCLSSSGTKAVYGAVARYVFDVGAWQNSRWVVFAGVSGNPASPHYTDQHTAWAEGRMVPMLYEWPDIAAQSKACHLLSPKDSANH
jgi:penicillin amidase